MFADDKLHLALCFPPQPTKVGEGRIELGGTAAGGERRGDVVALVGGAILIALGRVALVK